MIDETNFDADKKNVSFPSKKISVLLVFSLIIAGFGLTFDYISSIKVKKQSDFIEHVSSNFNVFKNKIEDVPNIVNLAVCSGYLSWENQFYQINDILIETIAKLKIAFKEDHHLYSDYVEMENQYNKLVSNYENIFLLVRENNLKKAQTLLHSIDLEKNKEIIKAQAEDMNMDIERFIFEINENTNSTRLFARLMYAVSMLLLLGIFLYTFQIIKKWKDMINALHVGMEFEIHERTQELKNSMARESQASKMASLGEMASGIAHEVNNPLAIISGKANQLLSIINKVDFNDKEKALDGVNKIESNVQRIVKIIKGLRSYSRNADNDPMEKCKINPILDDAIALTSEKIKKNSIHLNIENYEDIEINGRSTQICQVLTNMISNAADAIANLESKWVNIKINSNVTTAYITITDSGNGIPQHIREKLMQPFFTTKEPGKGTGLGLSISKKIIEEHGGKLWIDHEAPNTSFEVV